MMEGVGLMVNVWSRKPVYFGRLRVAAEPIGAERRIQSCLHTNIYPSMAC